jgi:hypothetical protein
LVTVFSGSQTFTEFYVVEVSLRELKRMYPELVVRVGDAQGLDAIVRTVCPRYGIVPDVHRAQWGRYGQGAGHRRTAEMLIGPPKADLMLAFYGPDGATPGTQGGIKTAIRKGVPVWLHRQGETNPAWRPVLTKEDHQ